MRRAYTIKSGLIAILIYILIVFIAIWAFIENENWTQSSANSEQAIKVDMSSVDVSSNQHAPKADTKNKNSIKEETDLPKEENTINESREQVKEEPKISPKPIEKEIIKQKDNIAKEKPTIIKTPLKEITKTAIATQTIKKDATSLFDTVDAKAPSQPTKKSQTTTQKQITSNSNTQVSKKASDMIGGATSTKSSGVEDGYKSKVKSILSGWPAQSDFAGNKAKIKFVIEPSGRFDFDVISMSSNEEFNKGLIQYLKQLQKVGFGAHGGNRNYVFDVDFIAEK